VLRADEAHTPRDSIVVSFNLIDFLLRFQVYTDGSCQGKHASGVGIHFGEGHSLNLSQALPGPEHTSVLAEVNAVQMALDRLRAWPGYQ
jgi:ribonuclease HI